jgi:transcriptional regulator with XRE-family HTH domain
MPASRHTARYKRLRAALREARKAAGLTQAEVGERLGRPQSYVNKYESGERRLDVIEFLDVAAAIGLEVSRVLRDLARKA